MDVFAGSAYMNECIVCKKVISNIEKSLNMAFHTKCSSVIIESAWKMLQEQGKKNENN